MNNIIITYSCFYLFITFSLTVWVADALFRNRKVFLQEIFMVHKEMADNVNTLRFVGFTW